MQSLLDKIKQTTLYSIETLSRKVNSKKKTTTRRRIPKKSQGVPRQPAELRTAAVKSVVKLQYFDESPIIINETL